MDISIKEDLLSRIEASLENIRPYLKEDGGDVKLVDIDEDHVVLVELLGSCESCPMSPMTMKAGIEEAVKKAAPEVTAIKAINAATV